MTVQRRRRSSLLLLSLVSCSSVSAVGAGELAHTVHAVDDSRPTAANKYRLSATPSDSSGEANNSRNLRGLTHPNHEGSESKHGNENENTNAGQSQRIHDVIIDLAAPLADEAVIPSPLESKAGKTNQQASSTSSTERDLKKDKDDKEDKNDKDDKKEEAVTIIEPKSHSIIGTGNTVYHVSAGVIDLTNAPIKIPPSTPAQCFEIKPYMGCDRGGADNQRLVFFGHDFGMGCAQADPCLFALMPIRMAYYCPKQGRPVCGGKCYSVAQHCPNGVIVDADGITHSVSDPKWTQANADAWNFWPANFGCPSCVS